MHSSRVKLSASLEATKELFLNPYENESVSNVTAILSNDWEITMVLVSRNGSKS